MYLIIDNDGEVVTTEDGERDFASVGAAEAFIEMLPFGWGAPLRIVEAAEWYADGKIEAAI